MQNKNLHNEQRLREVALPLLGKWVPFIILLLAEKDYNFAELDRAMVGVSRKVLTENLRQLLASGLIQKEGESSTGFPVSYSLTPLGLSVLPILEQVKSWLRENEQAILSNRANFETMKAKKL
ncbi:winged helix-turn-helix transcriptional regulator [Enterococcus sp. HY326]|uniref:winged helix-turn-helix transcriptional regulator n=1 Tax=Enterococcus sp. HY326 TaxID=2971265 RepID=UPI002240360F|nr:helix-turn-helix domain-containing protein [Enterococcus sp. HY326]